MEAFVSQGTDAWLQERAACATASCFADILAVSARDGKPLKARNDYLMRLVVERITGEAVIGASSFATNWGHDAEPYARTEYEKVTGRLVREVGFIKHSKYQWVGASSDGMVGAKGGVEIKCPFNSAIHLQTWLEGMPEHHLPQVMGQMWVLNLDWIDFCSYDPRMQNGGEHLKLFRQRVMRDDAYIAGLQAHVIGFLDEVQSKVDSFLAMGREAVDVAAPEASPAEPSWRDRFITQP